jgi:DNA-binding CsgD family transcriptional regulator
MAGTTGIIARAGTPQAGDGQGERRQVRDAPVCSALRMLADQLGFAVFILARDGHLLHANGAGRALLDSPSPFRLASGALHVDGRPVWDWATQLSANPGSPRCATVLHRSGRARQPTTHRVAIPVFPLRRASDPLLLCVYSSHTQRDVDPGVLRCLYALTQAEAIAAARMFAGRALADIARERRTSVHTVRTQIKRVLIKCQVRSQSELCRLLATGPGLL